MADARFTVDYMGYEPAPDGGRGRYKVLYTCEDNPAALVDLAQRAEAEAAAMRAALTQIAARTGEFGWYSYRDEIAHVVLVDIPAIAAKGLDSTTAGTDLLDRLRVATDALEAVERCERERQSRANRVRADIPPDRALHNESVAKCTAALRRLKGG